MSAAADVRALLLRRGKPLTTREFKASLKKVNGPLLDQTLYALVRRGELLRIGDGKPYSYALNTGFTPAPVGRPHKAKIGATELLRRRIAAVLRAEGGPVMARQVAEQLPGVTAREVLSELNAMGADGLVYCDGREFTLQAGVDLPAPPDDGVTGDDDPPEAAPPPKPRAAVAPRPAPAPSLASRSITTTPTPPPATPPAAPPASQSPVVSVLATALARWITTSLPPELLAELEAALPRRAA